MRGYEIVEKWKSCNLDELSIIDLQYMVDDLVGIVESLSTPKRGNMFSEEFRQHVYVTAKSKMRAGVALAVVETAAVIYALENAAQQSGQLTALRRGLAVSFCLNLVLLAVVAFTIGGN